MKRIMIALGLASALAVPALAQDVPQIADTDGNGLWSMDEMKVAYPTLTEETFAAVDTTADGQIDQAELAAAVTAGVLVQ